MGEPERGEVLLFFSLFFSLFFAQVKDPKTREIIIKGAHREGAKEKKGGQRLKSGEREGSSL